MSRKQYVYLVTSGEYSDYRVAAAYATAEAANAAATRISNLERRKYSVLKMWLQDDPELFYKWTVEISPAGTMSASRICGTSLEPERLSTTVFKKGQWPRDHSDVVARVTGSDTGRVQAKARSIALKYRGVK